MVWYFFLSLRCGRNDQYSLLAQTQLLRPKQTEFKKTQAKVQIESLRMGTNLDSCYSHRKSAKASKNAIQ